MEEPQEASHDTPPPAPSSGGASPQPAQPSPARKLLRHASHYSLASLLSVISGLVTFPLLTRTFSVHDYGLLSLLSATLGLAVTTGKTGIQHGIVRYFAEIAAGKSIFSMKQLHATTILGMLATALVACTALIVGAGIVPGHWIEDDRVRGLLVIIALLAVVEVLDSAVSNLLVADQRSSALLKYQFAKKTLGLVAILVALLLIAPSLAAFWWAKVIAEVFALLLPLWILFAQRRELFPRLASFSGALYRELLAFGLPMTVGYELSGVVLNVGDRYILDAMIGTTALGLYSAAYSLSQYVQSVFVSAIGMAIMPLYMRMWDEEGAEKTAAFISRALRTYVLIAVPIVAGLSSVGPELLPALASDRYASAGNVIPWVSGGMVVDGIASFLGAGLFVHRKAHVIGFVVSASAILNVVLNLLLIRHLGLLGAAVATLASYSFLCLAFAWRGQPLLDVRFPWPTALRAVLAAVVMFAASYYLLPGQRFLTVGVRVAVGVPVYLGVILSLDADARRMVDPAWRRIRDRFRGRQSWGRS